mgnify:CR=1 FL=1
MKQKVVLETLPPMLDIQCGGSFMEWNKSSQCRSCVCTPAFSKNESQGGGRIGRPLFTYRSERRRNGYEHLQKLDDYLFAERGLHLTWLRHPKGFEWLMFEEKKQRPASIENRQRLGVSLYGNGWPGPRVRWCTGQLKTHLIHKEINRLKGQYKAVSYVGIAADEPKRIKNERYPLMDWGITEKEALRICYDRGYDFGGLYQIYRRCSCWCCPLQGIGEPRKLRQHHPELWERLREMDKRALAQFGPGPLGQFKKDWSVERLEQRFAAETQQLSISSSQKERER